MRNFCFWVRQIPPSKLIPRCLPCFDFISFLLCHHPSIDRLRRPLGSAQPCHRSMVATIAITSHREHESNQLPADAFSPLPPSEYALTRPKDAEMRKRWVANNDETTSQHGMGRFRRSASPLRLSGAELVAQSTSTYKTQS